MKKIIMKYNPNHSSSTGQFTSGGGGGGASRPGYVPAGAAEKKAKKNAARRAKAADSRMSARLTAWYMANGGMPTP